MNRSLLLVVGLALCSIPALAGEYLMNETGHTAFALRVVFSEPVSITSFGDALVSVQPRGESTAFVFSGGEVEAWGGHWLNWNPNSASIIDYSWLATNAQQFVLNYTLLAQSKGIREDEIDDFVQWFEEWSCKETFLNALLSDINDIGAYWGVDSQEVYDQVCAEHRIVLRSGFWPNQAAYIGAEYSSCFVDQPAEALYILSLFYRVCRDLGLDIEGYNETAIAYAVVWDAMVYFDHTDGLDSRDSYLTQHMELFLGWNEAEELVFDLRELAWSDVKHVIGTAEFSGDGWVHEYPLVSLRKLHEDHWMGSKDSTYEAFTGWRRLRTYSSTYPNTGDWSWFPETLNSCGAWATYESAVGKSLGIPVYGAHMSAEFSVQHGTWSSGTPRYGWGHYVTAYKQAHNGEWFYGLRAITEDSGYGNDRNTEIPAACTLSHYQSLGDDYFLVNDLAKFDLDMMDPQICGEVTLFRRRTIPWEN